jgi:putative membrane protein insertion efficiency factor
LSYPFQWTFLKIIRIYQWTLSPLVGRQCRFSPTCSRYGYEAIEVYGPWRGGWMTVKRICRCNPLTKGGYDPVPPPPPANNDFSQDNPNGTH